MPYQCKIILKHSQAAHIALFKHVFSRYFLVKCVIEEVSLVVTGDEIILGLIVNCVINCCYYVMINEVAQIFLLLIFEIFAVDVEIIEIICRKNTSC